MLSGLVFAVWLLVIGAAGGSAMAAVADRLQAGQPWTRGRSRCAQCNATIGWGDLVPVASYVTLGGQCRHCGEAIPPRLLYAELAGLSCAGLALVFAQDPSMQIAATLFLLLLLGLFLCDLQTMRLPDILTGALALAGLWIGSLWHGLPTSALAAAIGVAAFLALAEGYRLIRGREGLGFGDIKMMAGLSAMAGPINIAWITLIAAVSALGLTLLTRRPMTATTALPLGCYLAIAGAAVWVMMSAGLL